MEAPAFHLYDKPQEIPLSEEAVKGLFQTKQDFLEGKTTARLWEEMKGRVLNKL